MKEPKAARGLVSYPLPIGDVIASLYLPVDLTQKEAERIKKIVDSLVVEEKK